MILGELHQAFDSLTGSSLLKLSETPFTKTQNISIVLSRRVFGPKLTTVALISRRGVPLTLEHMSQMATTVGAHNLGPLHAKGAIGVSSHSPRDGVEKGRPAAARLELVVGFVERGVAASAGVGAFGGHVFVKGAAEGGFGAFVAEDAELFCANLPLVLWSPLPPLIVLLTRTQLSLPLLLVLLQWVGHVV